MSSYDYNDYHSIAEDADELCEEDQWTYEEEQAIDKNTWENYYHNIASELTEQ